MEHYDSREWTVTDVIDRFGPTQKTGAYKLTLKVTDGNVSTIAKKWFNKDEPLWEEGKKFTAELKEVTNAYGTDLMVEEPRASAGFARRDDPAKESRIMRGNALNAASYMFAGKGKDQQGAMWAAFRALDDYMQSGKRTRMSTAEQHEAIVKMFKNDVTNARAAVWQKFGREFIEELTFEEADTFQRGVS